MGAKYEVNRLLASEWRLPSLSRVLHAAALRSTAVPPGHRCQNGGSYGLPLSIVRCPLVAI
eukprot:1759210-Pleurochrysis_carterae.AAC.2